MHPQLYHASTPWHTSTTGKLTKRRNWHVSEYLSQWHVAGSSISDGNPSCSYIYYSSTPSVPERSSPDNKRRNQDGEEKTATPKASCVILFQCRAKSAASGSASAAPCRTRHAKLRPQCSLPPAAAQLRHTAGTAATTPGASSGSPQRRWPRRARMHKMRPLSESSPRSAEEDDGGAEAEHLRQIHHASSSELCGPVGRRWRPTAWRLFLSRRPQWLEARHGSLVASASEPMASA
jgi:hypothetical protein